MILKITSEILKRIHAHGEAAYPEEGAGLMLGTAQGDAKQVTQIVPLANAREDGARRNRYFVTPQDYLAAEDEADRLGLDVLGIFHSHPDHPNQPSDFDLQWAMPWFSYLITSVHRGISTGSRSWQLADDRSQFLEEQLEILPEGTVITQ